MKMVQKWLLALLGVLVLGVSGVQAAMTNSAATIYSSVTSDYEGTFDGLIGIGVAILTVSVIYALIRSMISHRARVK